MSFLLRVIVVVSWLIFAVQSADWCLVDNTISYQESTNCSQTGFNIGIDYNLGNAVKFNFIESCCVSSTMYLLDDGQETTTKSISFSTPTQLTNFQFCEENTNTLTHIYLQNSNNMLLLFFGCSSSVSDSIVDLLRYDMDSFIWSSQDNSFILSLVDYYSSPYVYIDGVTKPIVALNIKTSSSPNYNQFLYFASGNFIVGDVTNWGVVVSYFTNVTLCERENFGRYGVISSYVELPDSDCGCIPQGSKLSDGYSYPDCNYNNSLLDLTISDTQLTLEIDTSQTDWNTLSFTSTITLTSETFSTLSLNNFSIDEDKLFVSEHPIIVNKLNINGVGNYFFNSISILDLEFTTSFEKNVVIFTGTANDLSSYGISVYCGSRYALDNSDIDCSCYYDNGFTQMDCEYTSRESTNLQNLELYSDVNLTLERYWGTITTFIPSISITGNTNAEVCNFESSKVEINGYINCTTLVIGESTEIIMNGILDVINIEINGNISNLNSNGIIQLQNGSSNFSNIQSIVMNSSECVEFMSFKESQNNFTNTFFDDINVYLLSINKLIRFCKTENMDVDCIVNVDNFFDEYDVIHCPCNDINCTLRIETPTLNFLKEDILSHMIAYQNTTFIDVTSINTIEFNSSLTILLTGIETSIENIVSSTQNITLLIQTPTTINSYYIPTLIPLSETTITNTITEIENLVIYSNHHQVIISDSVNTLTIKEITLKESLSTPILNCQQSTNPLIFSVPNTLSEYSIIDSVIIIEQKYRQLTSCTFSCDNQIVFINETGISCKDLGYFEHFCIYNSDYYDIYEKIDYSCPCNNEESWCIIKVDPLQSYFKPLYSIDSITFSSNLVLEMNYDILEVNSTTSEVELEIVGNNNVLSMTNESSNFYIVLSSLNMLIGFEKGFAIGSEKQFSNVENSLKSSYSIVVENGLSCKNMIYQDSQVSCIICDTFFNNNECVETVEIPSNCISFDSEKNVCIECVEGYYAERYECIPCASNCRRCNENLECILCENNFYINNGNCSNVNDFVEMYYHGKIMKCVDGMYVTSSGCDDCGKDCVSCISETSCTICNNTQESDGNCSILDGVEIATHLNSISCSDGYVFQMNQCVKCSDIFGNDCSTCAIDQCLSCETGVILSNGSCGTETGCVIIDSKCVGCINDSFMFDGYQCVSYFDNCEWCINFECVACVNGYFFGSDDMCYDSAVTECKVYDEHGNCIRCENGLYTNNSSLCSQCPKGCSDCVNSETCVECESNYTLSDYKCIESNLSELHCETLIEGSSGCAICSEEYFRNGVVCEKCIDNCIKCYDQSKCITCKDLYYKDDNHQCISYDELTNCINKTSDGCLVCSDGYFVDSQKCELCSTETDNCYLCDSNSKECTFCNNNYVLENTECIHYSKIEYCTSAANSKCSQCSFWHSLNSDGTACEKHVVSWVIVLIVLISIAFLGCLILFIIIIVRVIENYMKKIVVEKQFNIKKISDYEEEFSNSVKMGNILVSKTDLLFQEEQINIPVKKISQDIIYVGNIGTKTAKIQLINTYVNSKYTISFEPPIAIVGPKKAAQFKVFITPLFTTIINTPIILYYQCLKNSIQEQVIIDINVETEKTCYLDPESIIEDNKIGEGGFGIVYSGLFEGNQVAIKYMKTISQNNQEMEEFNKEVSMLDKFRSDYIVHFYGVVVTHNKICMVTELAQYGSLQDLIKTKEKVSRSLRIKMLTDAAKGILYLHNNGILHRDIKPDNVLVTSLSNNILVNAKLTDFGSSRNVNMLMTNMTFTKGIGTPIYMAPEVLRQKRYKKAADTFSFAITMYEVWIWKTAYDVVNFPFPWSVANFIESGNRLRQPTSMPEEIYSIIDNCWKHKMNDRIDMFEVVYQLEHLPEDVKIYTHKPNNKINEDNIEE